MKAFSSPSRSRRLWDPPIAPQAGPTPQSRIPSRISAVFPILHTPYEYYYLSFSQ
jgi:hypothetical protein